MSVWLINGEHVCHIYIILVNNKMLHWNTDDMIDNYYLDFKFCLVNKTLKKKNS